MKSIIEVITAADSYDLTTVDAVRRELKKTSLTADETILIQSQISGISLNIARYLNRILFREEVVETFWPDPTALNQHGGSNWPRAFWGDHGSTGRSEKLQLARYPIFMIDSIEVDGEPELYPNLYRIDDEKGWVFRLDENENPWTWFFGKKIVVRYRGGYDPIPADVSRAATLSCVDSWSSASKDSLIKSETIFDYRSVSYFDNNSASAGNVGDLSPRVLSMLQFYRRYPVA